MTKRRTRPKRAPYGRCNWCGAVLKRDFINDKPYRYCSENCLFDDLRDTARKQRSAEADIAGWFSRLFTGMFQQPQQRIHAAIAPEMFKKLLFLCHPDKHNNHPWAQEVTRWLLEERKKSNPGPVHTYEATEREV